MFRILISLLNIICTGNCATIQATGCSFSINNDLGEPQPLIANAKGTALLYPDYDSDSVTIPENTEVTFACPGSQLQVNSKLLHSDIEIATCKYEKTFEIAGEEVSISDITCTIYPIEVTRITDELCKNDNRFVEVGYELNDNFIHLYTLCFDFVHKTSVYSTFDLTSTIAGYQRRFPRPNWIEDPDLFNITDTKVNIIYTRKNQRAVINELLGLPSNDYSLITASGDLYLARGHLTAKADFVYGNQQRGTFHLANVCPQWQSFNGGNWFILEANVRDFAISQKLNLEVYTGIHEVLAYPHADTGKNTELFLYESEDGSLGIPVPKYYWKVLYDPATKRGTAFIGVNDPYLEDVGTAILCEDISDEISWLTWVQEDVRRGYSYACTVESLAEVVDNVPDLDVKDLLI